jgi:hypothetical protein
MSASSDSSIFKGAMAFIAPIVEGHGEIEALPILLRRIARHANEAHHLQVNPPIRVKLGSFVNDRQYFERYIRIAAAKAAQARGTVLILLDCDDDCPARLGPSLLERAEAVRGDVPYLVALAHREFESWFIASIASLCGKYGLPDEVETPTDVEAIRDAKGWLGKRMPSSHDPVTHQHQFTRLFDLELARRSQSFDRLYRKVSALTVA